VLAVLYLFMAVTALALCVLALANGHYGLAVLPAVSCALISLRLVKGAGRPPT
jgi:hypothetical protein